MEVSEKLQTTHSDEEFWDGIVEYEQWRLNILEGRFGVKEDGWRFLLDEYRTVESFLRYPIKFFMQGNAILNSEIDYELSFELWKIFLEEMTGVNPMKVVINFPSWETVGRDFLNHLGCYLFYQWDARHALEVVDKNRAMAAARTALMWSESATRKHWDSLFVDRFPENIIELHGPIYENTLNKEAKDTMHTILSNDRRAMLITASGFESWDIFSKKFGVDGLGLDYVMSIGASSKRGAA